MFGFLKIFTKENNAPQEDPREDNDITPDKSLSKTTQLVLARPPTGEWK